MNEAMINEACRSVAMDIAEDIQRQLNTMNATVSNNDNDNETGQAAGELYSVPYTTEIIADDSDGSILVMPTFPNWIDQVGNSAWIARGHIAKETLTQVVNNTCE